MQIFSFVLLVGSMGALVLAEEAPQSLPTNTTEIPPTSEANATTIAPEMPSVAENVTTTSAPEISTELPSTSATTVLTTEVPSTTVEVTTPTTTIAPKETQKPVKPHPPKSTKDSMVNDFGEAFVAIKLAEKLSQTG